jgi:hypothetical protein
MTKTVEVAAFFERQEATIDGSPGGGYVAGVRETNGSNIGVAITLPADLVERAVLAGARLAVMLSPDGRLVLDSDHVSDEALEAASAASATRQQTLESLVAECLPLDLLQGEEDPIGDLTALRGQLVRALAHVDGTLAQLQQARTDHA